ncbi:hypothetical protein DJ030_09500 [bacterium endosymbiont of Escarpia laminata]|nr:MAG: hypothetical protein DJ030_09500 [bacterium endosymbiont of Escarpia laminata]
MNLLNPITQSDTIRPFALGWLSDRIKPESVIGMTRIRTVGEGLNRIVKIVKNRASGYRNLESFADMIYLTVGDFDIPAHIPSDLRTL